MHGFCSLAQNVVNFNGDRLDPEPNIYHFRSYSGVEVDLILEINGTLFPIEIKAKSQPNRRDIQGFKALRDCFPHEKIHDGLLICSIEEPRKLSDNVLAIPWSLL